LDDESTSSVDVVGMANVELTSNSSLNPSVHVTAGIEKPV
jgi:hypothetical protein